MNIFLGIVLVVLLLFMAGTDEENEMETYKYAFSCVLLAMVLLNLAPLIL